MPANKREDLEYYILQEVVSPVQFRMMRNLSDEGSLHEALSQVSAGFSDQIRVIAKGGIVMEPISHSCFIIGDKLVVTFLVRRRAKD